MPIMNVYADESGVVIQSVQAAGQSDSSELVEIKNTSTNAVDITGWSLVYTSASGLTSKTILKFSPPDYSTRIVIGGGTSETIMSNEYASLVTNKAGLMTFSSGMNHLGGSLLLKKSAEEIVDMVGWGTATKYVEKIAAPAMSPTTYLKRTGNDTGDNSVDFVLAHQSDVRTLSYGQIDEVLDVCGNIAGIQQEVPSGMVQNEGMCENIFVPAQLGLTELLANPNGSDAGHEYIEIVNYETISIDLSDYMIRTNGKTYGFPDKSQIGPGEFKAWSDDDMGVVFANGSGSYIELLARGKVIDTMPGYQNAAIDTSWSRFENEWSYTNQLTPGGQNIHSVEIADEADDGSAVANQGCKDGYYRNELTGRCRKLPTTYQPTPCKEGQYRNEETGRCRSIAQAAAATLKPCADDQFRNPATGRCKKIASTDDMPAPCKDGYVRNSETNRCRKQLLATMPAAGFPVEPVTQVAGQSAIWWAIGGVAAVSLAYASWEWRAEVARILRRALGIISLGRL